MVILFVRSFGKVVSELGNILQFIKKRERKRRKGKERGGKRREDEEERELKIEREMKRGEKGKKQGYQWMRIEVGKCRVQGNNFQLNFYYQSIIFFYLEN